MPLKKGYSRKTFEINYTEMRGAGRTHESALAASYKSARESYFARYPQGALPLWLTPKNGKRLKNPASATKIQIALADQTSKQLAAMKKSPSLKTIKEYVRQGNPSALSDDGGFKGVTFEDFYKAMLPVIKKVSPGKTEEYYRDVLRFNYVKIQGKLAGMRRKNPVPPSKKVQLRNAKKLFSDFTGHEGNHIETVDKPVLPDVMLNVGEIDGILYTTVRDGVTEKYIHKFKKKCRPLFTVSHDGKQLFMLGGSYDFTELGIVDKT